MRYYASALLCGVLLAGCGNGAPDTQEATPATPEAYTPDAGAQLDANGRFTTLAQERQGELTALQARAIAAAFVNDFHASNDSLWSAQHGGPISYEQLAPCGRSMYAESSYEPVSEEFIRPVRSLFGSWWLVTLCEGRQSVMVVGVSALATDVSVSNGSLVRPLVSGEEFAAMGIPVAQAGEGEFRAPEIAAGIGYARTGARIRSVPVLVAARLGQGQAMNASWRLELEHPVRFTGARDARSLQTDTVYVGVLGRVTDDARGVRTATDELIIPATSQPAADSVAGVLTRDLSGIDEPSRTTTARAARRTSVPLVFELAAKNN